MSVVLQLAEEPYVFSSEKEILETLLFDMTKRRESKLLKPQNIKLEVVENFKSQLMNHQWPKI